jgi:hypothetical protein
MRFDWYAATIADSPQNVLDGLVSAWPGEAVGLEAVRPMHGYTHATEVLGRSGVLAKVLYGGPNGAPNAWASGEDTGPFVEAVRKRWGGGGHYVTRFDAAEDFQKVGAFDQLYQVALARADADRLKVNQSGDWHRLIDGRTTYVGSKKSPVFVRLYEKGKQMRQQVASGAELISADWVRMEVQVRPQKDARMVAASASPVEAWGFSAWTRKLCADVFEADVPRVEMHVYRAGDDERALQFMCRQYGPMLGRLCGDLGDWKTVGMQIGSEIEAQASIRRRTGSR